MAGSLDDTSAEMIAERVRERYAAAASRVSSGAGTGCGCGCSDGGDAGGGCCGGDSAGDAVSGDLYAAGELADLPAEAALASLGCGNPTALIDLREGETVLDLGSGGGIDVLLSARRVGPSGFAYGLDMTDEMLALAQANKAQAGAANVAFLKGRIEAIPLPAASVDVVISNCVINLAADKSAVLREAFRVLKPGGRFAVADVVADGPVPDALRHNMEAWVGCLAGALDIATYERLLAEAGFTDVSVTITRRYTAVQAGLDTAALPADWQDFDGRLASAFVRATRPAAGTAASGKEDEASRRELPVVAAGAEAQANGCCCG